MKTATERKPAASKRAVLILAIAMNMFGAGGAWLSMVVLFKEIAAELDLNLLQLGAIWGMVPLARAFIAFPGGLLGDRFGVQKVIGIACILVGLASLLRGLAVNFAMLAAFMFLFGIFEALVRFNLPKALRLRFEPKELGLANGVVGGAVSVGGALAVMFAASYLSPALGGWRNVFFLFGVILSALGLLWLLIVREPGLASASQPGGGGASLHRPTFREASARVLRLKDVWLVTAAIIGIVACNVAVLGYLPTYLESTGMKAIQARAVTSYYLWAFFAGDLVLPKLSDELGLRKPVYLVSAALLGISALTLPLLSGSAQLMGVLALGFFGGGVVVHHSIMVTEMKSVGARYAGTAGGLMASFSGMGGFLSPILGALLADADAARPFLLWGAFPFLSVLSVSLVREMGYKAQKAAEV